MRSFERLDGKRFGRLRVWAYHGKVRTGATWLCECDCGGLIVVPTSSLKGGYTKSCGCYGREHPSHRIHGGGKSQLYIVWKSMRERCNTPSCSSYPNYGGRGISVCKEWNEYSAFRMWAISHGYKQGLTIDRRNNSLGYSPENCRWTDYITQANNRRNTVYVEFLGQQIPLAEAARLVGKKYSLVHNRISRGWSAYDALTRPVKILNQSNLSFQQSRVTP